VGNRYSVIQNEDVLSMFELLLSEGKLNLYSGGYFLEGQQCYATMRIPGEIKIMNEVVLKYIVLTWSHDGTGVLSANFIPYVQNRKVSLASFTEGKALPRVEIRHTAIAKERIKEASEIYHKAILFFEDFSNMINDLSTKELSFDRFQEILDFLYPNESDKTNKNGDKKVSGDEKKRSQIFEILQTEIPSSYQETQLGAILAISEHSDYYGRTARRKDKGTGEYRRSEAETKLHSSLFGVGAKTKEKAIKTIINFDDIKRRAEEARIRRETKTKEKEGIVL